MTGYPLPILGNRGGERGGRTRRPGYGRAGHRERWVGNNEDHAREARFARPGIGRKGGWVGGWEKGFRDADFERVKAKSTTNYGVQELSSVSGCGSHS